MRNLQLLSSLVHVGALLSRPPRSPPLTRVFGGADAAASELLLPYGKLQLPSSDGGRFSVFSWNCLLPNSADNWWCEKMYQAHVPAEARRWPHRQALIRERIELADADIVCIQEAAGETFDDDFGFMRARGYASVLHRKFRFRCATFYRPEMFALEDVAHEDRTLVTSFRPTRPSVAERTLYVANVHLSGGAAPERRLRQIHGATERIRKWSAPKPKVLGRRGSQRTESPAPARNASSRAPCVLIAGDFNSDGDTAVRRLLVDGAVHPHWREPQYRDVELTSKVRSHGFGAFADAGEVAYRQNVCDGDWGDFGGRTDFARYRARRPATYVVPSLASVFLQRGESTTNRQQVVVDNMMLERLSASAETVAPPHSPRGLSPEERALCAATEGADAELVAACRRVFDAIDADRGGSLSAGELRAALERLSVRDAAGETASDAGAEAMVSEADADHDGEISFGEFVAIVAATRGADATLAAGGGGGGGWWWSRFLRVLGGDPAADPELVRLESEEDVDRLIARFTPAFRGALDALFDRLATAAPEAAVVRPGLQPSDDDLVPESAVLAWLELVNRELGRGGTYRRVVECFERSGRRALARREWHAVFAGELADGKWWQVAYDLDVSGVSVADLDVGGDAPYGDAAEGAERRPARRVPRRHYEAWLDYVYYSTGGLRLAAYQEVLSEEQARLIYKDGDALPNAWHPSDHLPVGCVFEWQ